MRKLSDESLMGALQEIERSRLDEGTRAAIRNYERSGLRVSMFEIRENGEAIVVIHRKRRPSIEAVRTAYEQVMLRAAATEGSVQ
jgi:hypothetical protein